MSLLLSELQAGEVCVIEKLSVCESMRRRLLEMGFQVGEEIKCMFTAPGGSPLAFWVKGSIIALRRNDCEQIRVLKRDQ